MELNQIARIQIQGNLTRKKRQNNLMQNRNLTQSVAELAAAEPLTFPTKLFSILIELR